MTRRVCGGGRSTSVKQVPGAPLMEARAPGQVAAGTVSAPSAVPPPDPRHCRRISPLVTDSADAPRPPRGSTALQTDPEVAAAATPRAALRRRGTDAVPGRRPGRRPGRAGVARSLGSGAELGERSASGRRAADGLRCPTHSRRVGPLVKPYAMNLPGVAVNGARRTLLPRTTVDASARAAAGRATTRLRRRAGRAGLGRARPRGGRARPRRPGRDGASRRGRRRRRSL